LPAGCDGEADSAGAGEGELKAEGVASKQVSLTKSHDEGFTTTQRRTPFFPKVEVM
jgi:hypothetical protein